MSKKVIPHSKQFINYTSEMFIKRLQLAILVLHIGYIIPGKWLLIKKRGYRIL